jgi:hypothetical protein
VYRHDLNFLIRVCFAEMEGFFSLKMSLKNDLPNQLDFSTCEWKFLPEIIKFSIL